MRISHAIVFVSDMNRSVTFYRDVVGLPLKYETPEWTEFATEGATLALHHSEKSSDVTTQGLTAGTCRPGLDVPDLDKFHERMVSRDVPCVQEPKEIHGVRLAKYLDPDGLAISVGEGAK